MRNMALLARRVFVVLALVLPLALLVSTSALAENHLHHLGFALGYQKLLSNDLKNDASGIDFTNAAFGALGYRYSVLPNLDLCVDARATRSSQTVSGVDLTLTNSFFGPGVRIVSPIEGVRPYVQANIFLVKEQVETEEQGLKLSASETGAGFGLCGGVDIRASDLISVPIEGNFKYGKPSDNVSGLGINVGLTFNFGKMGL